MAIRTFRSQAKAVALSPSDVMASITDIAEPIYVLAVRFYEAKNYPKALRLLEYLLRSQVPQFLYLRTTALVLQADQQFKKAIEFYQRAALSDVNRDPLVTLGHAQCLVMLKRYQEALPLLEQTGERLKQASISSSLRTQLVKKYAPLLERVQQLSQPASGGSVG